MSSLMSKRLIPAAAVALLLGTTAYAASVHLSPPHSSPTFTDNGLTLTASGTLSGLGNVNGAIFISADANVAATCTNPGNSQTQPPGQNPAPITVTGSEPISISEIKNGNF